MKQSTISEQIKRFEVANPLFYLLDSWSRVMVHGEAPTSSRVNSLFTLGSWNLCSWYLLLPIEGAVISLSAYNNEHPKSSIAVSVQNLGLTYTTSIDKKPTLKARLKSLGRGKKHTRVVRALR